MDSSLWGVKIYWVDIEWKEEQSKREKRKEHKLLELPENNVVSKGNLCNRE